MDSPHFKYSFFNFLQCDCIRVVVLTIVSRVVLELFQPQRVPGRLRLQLVRSREVEQGAVRRWHHRGGGSAGAAALQPPLQAWQSWKMWPHIRFLPCTS